MTELPDSVGAACSWGTLWGESGFLRMRKEAWLDGPNAPPGAYWRGIYSASRPVVGQGGCQSVFGWCCEQMRAARALQHLCSQHLNASHKCARAIPSCSHFERVCPGGPRPLLKHTVAPAPDDGAAACHWAQGVLHNQPAQSDGRRIRQRAAVGLPGIGGAVCSG